MRPQQPNAEVEYIVAHGIATRIGDKRVIIGSEHFVLEDEGVSLCPEEKDAIDELGDRYSLLYLAEGGHLAGLLCIEDPLRPEAASVVCALRKEGIKRIAMLTGDGRNIAEHAASVLGLDDYRAQYLPEQKTEYIKALQAEGAKIIMIGDGVNDSPALKIADVGISMKESADIAREISDVVLNRSDLRAVVNARKISTGVMKRIGENYALIVAINSTLLLLGLGGVITPSASALLHNASTIGASVRSLRPILRNKEVS